MQTETLIYIIISGIIALLLALFQYWYKVKRKTPLIKLFAFLRFLTIFSILLLLINPKLEQLDVFTEKPNLIIAVDNSESIRHLGYNERTQEILNTIISSTDLNEKFNISKYGFGENIKILDTLTFTENQTNIDQVFSELNQVYKQTIAPTIILSDGNQTFGNDFQFSAKRYNQPLYPIILGDTINHVDLKIEQLNVNKYAYLKNRFPVEAILIYDGNETVTTKFNVTSGNAIVYSQNLSLDSNNNSKIINFTIPANRVGTYSYKAEIIPLNTEKNKINNSKNFAIEVIDQKTRIALVSNIIHPDLGALKKIIESNEQRTVELVSPLQALNNINHYQLFIIYQPNTKFQTLFNALDNINKNRLIVLGMQTDLNFLNQTQNSFSQAITTQNEEYQAVLNSGYSAFIVNDLDFNSWPPIQSGFGSVNFSIPFETLLFKKVSNITTENPLLATFEVNNRREAVLFGEGIWRWRAQSYLNNQSFNQFDDFIGKLVQYLASKERRSRLQVDYESFYNGNTNIVVKAQYFNKNYEFDARENLQIMVTNKVTNQSNTYPLLLKNNFYEVDLSNLQSGNYDFTIKASTANISRSGSFTILDYNIEQQFLNANVTKLQQLATNSKGAYSFLDDYQIIIDTLLQDKRFVPIQKSIKKTVSLIDWKYLLALIALSLALEWFIRKYNGLI